MAFCVFADPHGDLRPLRKIAAKVDYFLCCGDLSFYSSDSFPKPIYSVLGNHEMFEIVEIIKKGILKIRNFNLIETGKVYFVEGLKIAGLNGNYSPAYKQKPKHFTEDDVEKCKKLKGIDIFLSHEAPTGIVYNRLNGKDMGIEVIKEIIEEVRPKLFFSGHYHYDFLETEIGKTKVLSLPKLRKGWVFLGSDLTYKYMENKNNDYEPDSKFKR